MRAHTRLSGCRLFRDDFAVQSPKVTAAELDRRIEAFIEDFRAVLAAMPNADFDRNKAAGEDGLPWWLCFFT